MKLLNQLCIGLLALSSTQVMAAGDITAGKEKSSVCASCHGGKGISLNPLWPNLAGQKQGYIAKQLHDFQSGKRKDPMMSAMAKPLSDQDIKDLAAYYASL